MYHFCDKHTREDLQKNIESYLKGDLSLNIQNPKFAWLLRYIRSVYQSKVETLKNNLRPIGINRFKKAKNEITEIFKNGL